MPTSTWSKLTDLPDGHPDILADLDKRYRRTYMIFTDKTGKKFPVYYGDNQGRNAIVLYQENGKTFPLKYTDELDIQALLPQVGYYNTSTQPVYIIKAPERQWKRSFSPNLYSIQGCTLDARYPNNDIWWDIANSVLNPIYAKLDDITIELFGNVALSRNFVVQAVKGIYMLIYRQQPIAQLDFKKRSVIITHQTFYQEIMDLFKYTGVCTWTIQ